MYSPLRHSTPGHFLPRTRHVLRRFTFAVVSTLSFYDDSSDVIMASWFVRLAVMNETYWSFWMSADELRTVITCRQWRNNSCCLGANLPRTMLACLLQR
jgi:hypothetical protein